MTDPTTPILPPVSEALVQTSSLARQAGVGMLWGQAAKVVEVGLAFAIAVVAIRALQPVRFGQYSLVTNLAGVGSILVPVAGIEALGAILPRFRDRGERVFVVGAITALRVGFIAVSTLVAILLWHQVRGPLGLAGVATGIAAVGGVYWLALEGLNAAAAFHVAELSVRTAALWRVAGQFVTLVALAVVVASGSASIATVMACVAFGYGLGATGLVVVMRRRPRRPEAAQTRFVLSFSRNVWLAGLLTLVLATQVDVLLLGAITKEPRQAAFYAVAVGVVGRAQVLLLSGWSTIVIPALSHARIEGGDELFARAWRVFAKLSLVLTLPVNVLLYTLATPLTRVLAGSSYAPAAGLVRWVAAFNIAVALLGGTLGVTAMWVFDRTGVVIRVRIVTALVNLLLAIFLIADWKALGAAIATGIAGALTSGSELYLARRYTGVRFPLGFALAIGIPSLIVGLPAILLHPRSAISIVVVSALGGLAFLAALRIVRPFDAEDLRLLRAVSPALADSPLRLLGKQ